MAWLVVGEVLSRRRGAEIGEAPRAMQVGTVIEGED